MRVITCNVNGIRSAAKKGFFEWAEKQKADFICLQETKAQLDSLIHDGLDIKNYFRFHSDALKPGYSGVAIYTPHKPLHVHQKLGFECADTEGRFIELEYKDFSIVSLYLPSGTSGDHRQAEKYTFMEKFMGFLSNSIHKNIIICGDWNIAHKNIDLKNWKPNQKHSGFLPEERNWLDKIFDELGWVDAFRLINSEAEQYTWWSNRGQAYAKNVGWRIDYQIISPSLAKTIKYTEIYKKQRFSDHAPLIMDYTVDIKA
jgi:exodeoxyribonuclease-3